MRVAWRIKHILCFVAATPRNTSLEQIFLVNERIKHLVLDFKTKSSRLCSLSIMGLFFNYSIICAHSPTEEKDDQVKDSFYYGLDMLFKECRQSDISYF